MHLRPCWIRHAYLTAGARFYHQRLLTVYSLTFKQAKVAKRDETRYVLTLILNTRRNRESPRLRHNSPFITSWSTLYLSYLSDLTVWAVNALAPNTMAGR